jgi:hypothetical protein
MIGLTFLAIGLLWLALSVLLAIKLPKWFGVSKPVWRGLLGGIAFVILMVGPFVDHIVGMRQFEKLCAEQTGLQIYPNAVNAKRAQETSSKRELISATVIPINRSVNTIVDLDTNAVIAEYKRFATKGGVVGGPLTAFGGEHVCSIYGSKHVDHQKYLNLKNQVNLKYGKAK